MDPSGTALAPISAMRGLFFLCRSWVTVLLWGLAFSSWAQSEVSDGSGRIQILNADVWEYDDAIAPGAQRLKGNVRFAHGDAVMQCDSAHLFQDQRLDAYGNVSIDQGDTLHMEGQRLRYQGKERIAHMEGEVLLRDKSMELTTTKLDYDLRARRGMYTQGGRIVSKGDGSTLTSEVGLYLSDQRLFQFSRNVRSEHPERVITCDTMHYATTNGMVRFFGPSDIHLLRDSTTIHTTRGSYDTVNDRARFTRRSSVFTQGRLLQGDSIHYDKGTGVGDAWGHVSLNDTVSDLVGRGQRGQYNELTQRSVITGDAELVFLLGKDSLFLHSDSLIAVPDSSGTGRSITGRRGVRFFKTDLQGACDTLVFSNVDSLIRMYHEPVLWTGADQITGDHIRISLKNGGVHRLFVLGNAFLMSEVDSVHFDQVTGSTMTGIFTNNVLNRLIAEGNSRTVYFVMEEKDGESQVMAVNRADCSRIEVSMVDSQVHTVSFLERPDAVLYPLEQVPPEELRMQGSTWRGSERPQDRDSIFLRPATE